jgi:hypothetical protein
MSRGTVQHCHAARTTPHYHHCLSSRLPRRDIVSFPEPAERCPASRARCCGAGRARTFSQGVSFLDSVSPMPPRYVPLSSSLKSFSGKLTFICNYRCLLTCGTKALPHHLQGLFGRIQPMVSPFREHLVRSGRAQHVCSGVSPLLATTRRPSHFHVQDCDAASHNPMLSRLCE